MTRLAAHEAVTQAEPASVPVKEAARRLGWTEKTVLRAIHNGTLRAYQPGLSRWYVFEDSLTAVLRTGRDERSAEAARDVLERWVRMTAQLLPLTHEALDALDALEGRQRGHRRAG